MGRDDAILPATRIVAAIIVPVLALAVLLLYFLPGETDRHWSWTINPQLTAMYMGAGYACGVYFFTRVLFGRSWRSVALGFLPITAFTSFLMIATVLHWENFDHDHVSFWLWTGLYAVTPFLIPALWLMNRRADPDREPGQLLIPGAVRGILALAGAALIALALLMLIAPSVVVDDWLWPLSDLTARVIGGFIVLTGGLLVSSAYDARWRAARVHIETFAIGTVLMPIAIVRDWDNLAYGDAVRFTYLGAVLLAFVLLASLYVWMERGRRAEAAG